MVIKLSCLLIAAMVIVQACNAAASSRALRDIVGGLNTSAMNTTGYNLAEYDTDACCMAYDKLMDDPDVSSAVSILLEALMKECQADDRLNEICQSNVGWTSTKIKMDVCNIDAYDRYKEACGAAGASFCSLDATADGDIGVLAGLFNYKMKLDMKCIAMCIPLECNPDMLEQGGMMGVVKDFLTNELCFDLSKLATSATITCQDPSGEVKVKEKERIWETK